MQSQECELQDKDVKSTKLNCMKKKTIKLLYITIMYIRS